MERGEPSIITQVSGGMTTGTQWCSRTHQYTGRRVSTRTFTTVYTVFFLFANVCARAVHAQQPKAEAANLLSLLLSVSLPLFLSFSLTHSHTVCIVSLCRRAVIPLARSVLCATSSSVLRVCAAYRVECFACSDQIPHTHSHTYSHPPMLVWAQMQGEGVERGRIL